MNSRGVQSGGAAGRLPDFLVIGAQKCGTTSLDHYLGLHPEIHMAKPKEPRFFVDAPPPEGRWGAGLEWYRRLFDSPRRLCGETSPQYTHTAPGRGVAALMAGVVPGARLVYSVREPMARLRSSYLMNARRGTFDGTFADYFKKFPPAFHASCYGDQLREYLRHYPLESILVVESSELLADRTATLRRVFRFLGADDSFSTPLFQHKKRVGDREVFTGPLGRRVLRSLPMRWAARLLPGVAHERFRFHVSRLFRRPAPPTDLPAELERELADFFREQTSLLRKLTGLALPSLGPA